MRFPGNRIAKHYFPVTKKATRVAAADDGHNERWFVVGLDEVLVDIEVNGSAELADALGLLPGESVVLDEKRYRQLRERIEGEGLETSYAAGGTVANTLNNYTHLSGEPAVLLGAMASTIRVGGPAFAYVAQTPKAVDLGHVVPFEGSTGTAVTFISDDGDRSFGVAPGVSGLYPAEAVPERVVHSATVVVTSLYCLCPQERPITGATLRLMELAKAADVPVAFGMGTAHLVREQRQRVQDVLKTYVTIAAMNATEAEALTGESDALLAADRVLEWVDAVVITEGPRGLTMAGYTDRAVRRETREKVRSKSIKDYNRWEYSRLMRRSDCNEPIRVYSHIHPYRGGPDRLSNTSGAGDAALAALLHDISANEYHRAQVPYSQKHAGPVRFLTYSSLSRCAQYCNRVAYEVLRGRSPRLDGAVGHDEEDDGSGSGI